MLYLHGVGHYHPDNVIDNTLLTELDIDTNHDWILRRVGIRQRRTVLPLDYIRKTHNRDIAQAQQQATLSNAQTGVIAAQMALNRADLTTNDIGMVIAGGCAPDYVLPANAAVIAAELGIDADVLDVTSACSTFVTQLHWLNQMQPQALPDYILLVIPENWTKTIDYSDRKTAVLVGDCSVAAVVSTRQPSSFVIAYSETASDPQGWHKVATPVAQHFCQEGPAVQKFAIKKTLAVIQSIREAAQLDPDSHYFIGHQANLVMLQSVCQKAGIASQQMLYNIDQYGNCGAAGAPSVLSQHWEKFTSGDQIVMAVVGAGLTWGGILIEVQ